MKLSDFPTYDINPFEVSGVVTKQLIKRGETMELANTDTGEITVYQKAGNIVNYDKDTLKFTKVFSNAITDIKDFSTPALKLWCYILDNIGIGTDEVYITAQDVMTYGEYNSKTPVYKALCELITKKFIARKVGTNLYFINPDKFYNGKRI